MGITFNPFTGNFDFVGPGGGSGPTSPASPDTSVQFNNAGSFGGSANLTWSGTALTVRGAEGADGLLNLAADEGDDATDTWQFKVAATGNALSILNNSSTYQSIATTGAVTFSGVVQTGGYKSSDGTAGTTTGDFKNGLYVGASGGSVFPAAPTNSVQFNNAGVFGGSAGFTYTDAAGLILTQASETLAPLLTFQVTGSDPAVMFPYADGAITLVAGDEEGYLYLGVDGYGLSTNRLQVFGPATATTAVSATPATDDAVKGQVIIDASTVLGWNGVHGEIVMTGTASSTVEGPTALYGNVALQDTSHADNVFGVYINFDKAVGASMTNVASFYATDLAGEATDPYYFWADSRGVFRIREDNVADGSGNPQAIPSLYNPRFTKYTPGLANFERSVEQWVSNTLQIGAEAGGTGVLRPLSLIGASVSTAAVFQAGGFKSSDGTAGVTASPDFKNGLYVGGSLPTLSIGATVTSGTAKAVLFVGTGPVLAQAAAASAGQLVFDSSIGVLGQVSSGITGTITPSTGFHNIGTSIGLLTECLASSTQGAGLLARKGRGVSITNPRRIQAGDNIGVYNARMYVAADDSSDASASSNNSGFLAFVALNAGTTGEQSAYLDIRTIAPGSTPGNTVGTGRIIAGGAKVLTDNSAIDIFSFTNAASGVISGFVFYSVEVTNGTDWQVETGIAIVSGYNKAGAFGCTVTEVNSQQNLSSGTLTTAWAITGAAPAVLSINADSSLTPSAGYPRITLNAFNTGRQAMTPVSFA